MEASLHPTDGREWALGRLPRALLLGALLAAAFLPRLAMSHLRPVLCTDAVFFLERAVAFERGDYEAGLSRLGLNPYPFILQRLHEAGLDWEVAGRAWSLALASLAVLPLYGLARRLFGQPAAIVACLLYAVQPELIEWSPEIIRDPTFWFLLLAALYYSHVAATANHSRLLWYPTAGICIALAGLVRFEGWFLTMPLVWWTVAYGTTFRGLLQASARLAVATAMIPLCLVAINLVFLSGHELWEWGRFDHLVMALNWTSNTTNKIANSIPSHPISSEISPHTENASTTARSTASYVPEDASKRPGLKVMCWGMAHTFLRGVHPVYVLAMCAGLWAARRHRFVQDQAPLWLLAAMNLGAVWIYFWTHHEITSRYMLLVALVGMPYAGLGVLWTAERFAGLIPRARFGSGVRPGVAVAIVVTIAAIGCHEALTSEYQSRHMKAELGRWILARYGAERRLLCSENLERLVGYYAGARHASISPDASSVEALERVDGVEPDVVALWMKLPSEQAVLAHFERNGGGTFVIYRGNALPASCQDVAVLVRTQVSPAPKEVQSVAEGVSLPDKARPLY